MSDMGDDFRTWNESKKRKKQANLDHSTRRLTESRIKFDSHNGGVHLVVHCESGLVDFWPSTGRFISRNGLGSGRGIENLLKLKPLEDPTR